MLARFFEAVVWYETGVFATQLVDPVTLSYKKLKTILECRGLAYTGLAEKKDVSQLVARNQVRLLWKKCLVSSQLPSVERVHFYELVEDTKDGIWLVQVIARDREALLSHSNWGKMVQKVSQFGIRTGTFNCSNDYRLCVKRGWQRSTLIMSVPQTSASKGKVMLKEYDGHRIEIEHIFRWMTSHVAQRIKTLRHSNQLVEEWCSDHAHPVKMYLFACLSQPPAFFSSLSVKFTGRIEFIFVDVRHWSNHTSLSEIGVSHNPAYILKTPEGIYHYGNSNGEFLSLAAMDTFLRSVQPEVNDLFVLSLVLVNLLSWMDLFITQGATVKRFVVLIRTLGTYNSLLLVSWLPVLALLQLPYLESLYGYSLKLLRYADTTSLASLVRADWTFYSSHPALFLSTYLAYGLLVDYFEKKRRCAARSQEDSTTNLEWLASLWDWYTSYLLHPITSLHQVPADQSDWEDDPNFLLERLTFPDLWLHPLVNMDYIKGLPTWRFKAGNQQREEESGRSSSPVRMLKDDEQRSEPLCCDQLCDWSVWPLGMLYCSECVVCLEDFISEELLMGMPCGHAFHQQCIVVWLAAGRHCCPVCRWPSYKKKHRNHTQTGPMENTQQD
uniref:Ring finger protein 103 n=1 Tax=Myripristis murdjan TaxID=586833 RepID=A0A667XZY1_9TELE